MKIKRSSFLLGLALALIAPFSLLARAVTRPPRPVRFYWVYEEGEIYAARDLAELNALLDEQLGVPESSWRYDDQPRLTVANRGEHWDEVSGEGIVHVEWNAGEGDEEEEFIPMTYRDASEVWGPFQPHQVATTYL